MWYLALIMANAIPDLNQLLHLDNGCEYLDLVDKFPNKTGNESINILHLNIQSFHKNADNLLLLLNDL